MRTIFTFGKGASEIGQQGFFASFTSHYEEKGGRNTVTRQGEKGEIRTLEDRPRIAIAMAQAS